MALFQPIFVQYMQCLNSVATLRHTCLHKRAWPSIKGVSQIYHCLADLDAHTFGNLLHFDSVLLLPVLQSKFKIVPLILGLKHILRQILKHSLSNIFVHVLLISACVFGGCSLWQKRVVIPVDIQRDHHFCTVGLAKRMNQVLYLWKLQSGLSCVASFMPLMLGWEHHYMIIYYNKGLYLPRFPFLTATLFLSNLKISCSFV